MIYTIDGDFIPDGYGYDSDGDLVQKTKVKAITSPVDDRIIVSLSKDDYELFMRMIDKARYEESVEGKIDALDLLNE